MLKRISILLLVLNAGFVCRAEVFVLTNGGRITGEIVNRSENPRKQYLIKIAGEGQITLAASQVEQVLHNRPDEEEYEKIRPAYPDTAEGQWELAEWCRQQKMSLQRETHLKRIIELDPDNPSARRALGYVKLDGQWTTRVESMIERGYVKYKNEWKLPQEIELIENKKKLETAQSEWTQNIKRWRGWFDTYREDQALENLHNITDPMAVRALAKALNDEALIPIRLIYVDVLAKINTPDAAMALAVASLSDPVEEVRLSCLDRLEKQKRPEIVGYFVSKLTNKKATNPEINLAGVALGRMKDPSSVGPLIDNLVTVHKFKVTKAGGDNSTSASFGNNSGGMTMGGGPKFVSQPFNNPAVLDALTAITHQNFSYNQAAWRRWQASQKKPDAIDARRD